MVRPFSGNPLSQRGPRRDRRNLRPTFSANAPRPALFIHLPSTYRLRPNSAVARLGQAQVRKLLKVGSIGNDEGMLARRFLVGRMDYHLPLLADADAFRAHTRHLLQCKMHNPPFAR